MVWPCYSGLFPSLFSRDVCCFGPSDQRKSTTQLMSTCLGDMICVPALLHWPEIRKQPAAMLPLHQQDGALRTCFGGLLPVGFSVLRPPCDEGRLSGALPSCFGGLLSVGLDVLQPLCEEDPVELRLRDVYYPLMRGYTLKCLPRK